MPEKKIDAFEALSRYALSRYKAEFEEAAPDCPYETRMGGYRALRQEISWFVYEWQNPATGATILEEFVRKRVPKDGRELAARLLLRKDITYDEFEVVDARGPRRGDNAKAAPERKVIRVRAQSSQKEYDMAAPKPPGWFARGSRFVGRIHPRGDGTYMVCGTLTRPGEWDESREEEESIAAALSSGAVSAKSLEMARASAAALAGSRMGPGRREGILEAAAGMEKTTHVESIRDMYEALGPDKVQTLIDDLKNDEQAFDAAMSAPIQEGFTIRQFLDNCPEHMLEKMCRELEIKSLPFRGMMAERISEELPGMVCAVLRTMKKREQSALAHILHAGSLEYPACKRELARRVAHIEEGEDPDDPEEGETFLHICAFMGLVAVGTIKKGWRGQKTVTVASDIKRRILECSGWSEYVKLDGRITSVESNYS